MVIATLWNCYNYSAEDYRVFYCHKTDGVISWYEIDLPSLVKAHPDLDQEYFTKKVTIQLRSDVYTDVDDSDVKHDDANATEVTNSKPDPRDMVMQILFLRQQIADSLQVLVHTMNQHKSVTQSVIDQMDKRRFNLIFSDKIGDAAETGQNDFQDASIIAYNEQVTKIKTNIEIQTTALDNLLKEWDSYDFNIDLKVLHLPEIMKLLNIPDVITSDDISAALAQVAKPKEAAVKHRAKTLNEALRTNQVQAIPAELLQELVQTWYHDSMLENLYLELDKFRQTRLESQHHRNDQAKLIMTLFHYQVTFESLLRRFGTEIKHIGCDQDGCDLVDKNYYLSYYLTSEKILTKTTIVTTFPY